MVVDDFWYYCDMVDVYVGGWGEGEDCIGFGFMVMVVMIFGLVLLGVGVVVNVDVGNFVGIGCVLLELGGSWCGYY